METSILSNQHVELPLVGRHAHILISHPDEMVKEASENNDDSGSDEDFTPIKPLEQDNLTEETAKDPDDDWDEYGDILNKPSVFKRKTEEEESNLPTSSSS